MRKLLLIYLVLFVSFQSFSQNDTITFTQNGYLFQTDTQTMMRFTEGSADTATFHDILLLIESDHSAVNICRASDNKPVKFKVKTEKQEDRGGGQGRSGRTYLILIDKKSRVEIVREVINISLAC